MRPSRRRVLAGLAAAGAVWLARPPRGRAQQASPPRGFQRIEGPVFVNGLPATLGAEVTLGAAVTTGAGGFAILASGRDGFLIRENSEAIFPEPSSVERVFRVVAGMMLSVFGTTPVVISTPIATVGIRGSACFVEARPALTYACVCYGHAELAANAQPEARERIATTHHEQPRYIHAGTSGALIEPAPVINHTDEELILLEALFGREPPFGTVPGRY